MLGHYRARFDHALGIEAEGFSQGEEYRAIPEVAEALKQHKLLNTPVNMLTARDQV